MAPVVVTTPGDGYAIDRVTVEDSTQVAGARALAVAAARAAGLDGVTVDRIALVATELAQNLHLHAQGGELLAVSARGRLTLVAVDRGPGVLDFDSCLVDGYSTAGTMGTGLGAVRRLATEFDAVSEFGRGTAVAAGFALQGSDLSTEPFDIATVGFPIDGEEINGDTCGITVHGARMRVLLADGLGHGPLAADASRAAAQQLQLPADGPQDLLGQVNTRLTTTRGAAVTVADLDSAAVQDGGALRTCGLGNVSVLMAAPDGTTKRIVTAHGTAGARITARLTEQTNTFPAGGTLVLHTDGLATRWDLTARPELLRHKAILVAAVLWRDFARGTDDSLVVVVKEATERAHG